jgi:hypothetical protein
VFPSFPSLPKQQKWFKYKRDVKVGDIIFRKDETVAGQTYKYARVTNVHLGSEGTVRAADIEYKVPGESKFQTTTRLIHKLVLVVPVEEQTMEEAEKQGGREHEGSRPEVEDGDPHDLGSREGAEERGDQEYNNGNQRGKDEDLYDPGIREEAENTRQPAGAQTGDTVDVEVDEGAPGASKGAELLTAKSLKAPNVTYKDEVEAMQDVGRQ